MKQIVFTGILLPLLLISQNLFSQSDYQYSIDLTKLTNDELTVNLRPPASKRATVMYSNRLLSCAILCGQPLPCRHSKPLPSKENCGERLPKYLEITGMKDRINKTDHSATAMNLAKRSLEHS